MTNLYPTSYLMGKTEIIPYKVRNETMVFTLSTLFKHRLGIPGQRNKIGRKIKRI
jgi:hypothetical protein